MRTLRIIHHGGADGRWRVVHGVSAAHLQPHVEAYPDDSETTHSFVRCREMPTLRPVLIVNLGTRRAPDRVRRQREPLRPDRCILHPPPRIGLLAQEIGWSQRRLATAFDRHVGHSPRMILRLARFRRLISRSARDARIAGRNRHWMPAISTGRI